MSTSEQQYIQNWLNQLYPTLVVQLPQLLKNGGFDPYGGPPPGGGFSWNLGQFTGGIAANAAQSVCGNVGLTHNAIWIPFPVSGQPSLPSIQMDKSFVNGFSQVSIPPFNAANPPASGFYAPLDQDRVIIINGSFTNSVLTINGVFSLFQNCCQGSLKTNQCDAGVTEQNLQASGNYTATVVAAEVQIVLQITALATNQLTVQANAVTLTIAATTQNMQVSFVFTQANDGSLQSYNNGAQLLFNQSSTMGTIVASLQQQLQMQSNLTIFGQEMTTQLDNFLQQNHYYPYGPPTLALI
jgi:hypothetical protein